MIPISSRARAAWAALLLLGAPAARADVRLLTGDADGQLHSQDSWVLDLSGDGHRVLFRSGLPPSGTTPGIPANGLYVRDLQSGTLRLVATNPSSDTDASVVMDGSMSDDGRYVAWQTANLNVYWRDTESGETRLLNPGAPGTSRTPILSADGRRVAFVSTARNLVADTATLPAPNRAAVYLYDSQASTLEVASVTFDGKGLLTGVGLANPWTEFDFSADGQWILFSTESTNVHPERIANGGQVLFWTYRRNIHTGHVDVVCRNAGGEIAEGNFASPRSDGTGNRILFSGNFVGIGGGPEMLPGRNNPFGADLYVKDMTTGEVWLVSRTVDGSPGNAAYVATAMALSRDGRVAAFGSRGSNHVPEPTDPPGSVDVNPFDIFRVDLGTGGSASISLVTRPHHGNENVGYFSGPFLPGDGRYVAFVAINHFPLLGTGQVSSIWEHGFAVGTFDPDPEPSAYDLWAAPLAAGDRAASARPFGDGITNLRKFVHGLGPVASDGAGLPSVHLGTGADAGQPGDPRPFLMLSVPLRRGLPAEFGVRVLSATTLAGLGADPVLLAPLGPPVADGAVDVLRFAHPVPALPETPAGWLQIEVFGP